MAPMDGYVSLILLWMVIATAHAQVYTACNFEQNNICTFINQQGEPVGNSQAGPFDWIIGSGRTDTGQGFGDPRTGPEQAYEGLYYLYVEGSDPRPTGDYALLTTTEIAASGTACVSYWYSMNGEGVGQLELYLQRGESIITLWQRQGDQGLNWILHEQTFTLNFGDRIGWRGTRGTDFRSDIALDQISVVAGACGEDGGDGGDGGDDDDDNVGSVATTIIPVATPGFQPVSTVNPFVGTTTLFVADNSDQVTDRPPDVAATFVILPYGCEFETEDICGFEQPTTDQFDWSRTSGTTPTSVTGPTQAYAGAYYMYIEASDPRAPGDYATLETPMIAQSGPACVEFYYHMRGEDIGALYINTASRPLEGFLMRYVGNLGDQWFLGQVDVNLGENDRVQFIGQRGNDIRGDIAIDSVRVRQGQCQDTPTTVVVTTTTTTPAPPGPGPASIPFLCSFEFDLCGMTQRQDDQFDWDRRQGNTETGDTGPDGTNYGVVYIYAEGSSPRAPNDRAVLDTPGLAYQGALCVHFWYHMYGQDMGTLEVNLSGRQVLFTRTGNQGNNWFSADISAQIIQGDVISFIAIRGPSYRSDIAIDDVSITPGGCSDVEPPPPTEPPPVPEPSDYFSCDFETDGSTNSYCRLRQDTRDQFDWTRTSGRTPSGAAYDRRIDNIKYPVTGPESARSGIYYGYIESSGMPAGLEAGLILEGTLFNVIGRNCLRFYYSMNGFHTGELNVFLDTGFGRQIEWRMAGDQLQNWHSAAVDLNMDGFRELGIKAITKGEFSGDISLDDIQFTYGPCQNVPSPYLWLCNFETSEGSATLCNMDQELNQDQFDWTLWSLETPSRVTGPSSAYNGQFYIYIEASSPRREGDFAKVLIPTVNYNGDVCVEFWSHMYGFHIDELELFTRLFGVDTEVWNLVGQQGNFWAQNRVTIEGLRSDQQIGFKGVRGGAFSGDIALDNVQIRPGRC